MSQPYPYWRKVAAPEDGIYKVVMITGWSPEQDMKRHVALYVCESLSGYLSEAFPTTEIGTHWEPVAKPEEET